MKYLAKYVTPKSSLSANGEVEFESSYRMNSKNNLRDARLALIELVGKEAITYSIVSIEKVR